MLRPVSELREALEHLDCGQGYRLGDHGAVSAALDELEQLRWQVANWERKEVERASCCADMEAQVATLTRERDEAQEAAGGDWSSVMARAHGEGQEGALRDCGVERPEEVRQLRAERDSLKKALMETLDCLEQNEDRDEVAIGILRSALSEGKEGT